MDPLYASGGWMAPSTQIYWGQPTPPVKKKEKTAKEMADLDVDSMSREELIRELNDTLVALEESQAAWQEEHDKRVAAEERVEGLIEGGFNEPTQAENPDDEDEEKDPTLVDFSLNYHLTPGAAEAAEKRLREILNRQVYTKRNSTW